MPNTERVYMLAADHRWQWEEWCDARSMPRARIGDVKRLAYDGFLLARKRSAAVREFGALLIDEQYASPVITDALKAGVNVGTPAEKAGAFPLEWSGPFSRALTGAFAKVLVRYRPDDEAKIRDGQWAKLEALQTWCHGAGKPLVIEVLVSRRQEPEEEFEASGRPAILAGFIGEAYRRALAPDFWKIEGTRSPEGAGIIDAAIAADSWCRQIILGKAADLSTIDRWFAAAAGSTTAVGFAIGRSVFWEPSEAFLSGTRTAEQAAADICANYLHLVDAWEATRIPNP
jgi:5-dehydro-2-deoxygluconokinase